MSATRIYFKTYSNKLIAHLSVSRVDMTFVSLSLSISSFQSWGGAYIPPFGLKVLIKVLHQFYLIFVTNQGEQTVSTVLSKRDITNIIEDWCLTIG